MYLKALEIQGFKSFADKTRLTFEKDITAIVGPNGSGKSNISDAILWVMGEQRSKALRGSKMEDVIFGGTLKRSPLGYAQVSLVLDNSAGIFDTESSELVLTRRYYRSGESEYFINRELVRLKDVNSILMDTGLGRDGYSIIGQGKIADIVSTKSTDRREVFEEAAGISRFRYRKEEAEKKLDKTEENLIRINDKIEELEGQVEPLRKQSETAKKYLLLRDELRVKEISIWMHNLDKLAVTSADIEKEYLQAASECDKAKTALDALYISGDSISERMHRIDEEREKKRDELSETDARAAGCESEIAVLRTKLESSRETKKRLIEDIELQEVRAAEIRERISDGEKRIGDISASIREISDKQLSNGNVIDGCRMKLEGREKILNAFIDEANGLSVEIRSSESRIGMLVSMEKEFEGYSKAVKTVMKEAGRGNVKGVYGPVANLVKAEKDYALAIETALGAASQNIVIDTQNNGRQAIEMLKRLDAGRATFLPIDTIKGSLLNDVPDDDSGYIGIAYELVAFDRKYEQIFANLLGRTLIVENLSDAVRISRKNGNKYRIVTLDGQLINAGGSMTGGSAVSKSGIISRANELEELRKKHKKLLEKEKECLVRLEKAKTEIAGIKYKLDIALEEKNSLQSSLSSLNAESSTTKAAVGQLELLLSSMTGDSEARKAAVDKADDAINEIIVSIQNSESAAAEIQKKSAEIRAEIDTLSNKKIELEGKRTKAEKASQEQSRLVIELERQVSDIQRRRENARNDEKTIIDKLWDNYELSHSSAQQIRQPVENIVKSTKEVNDLRKSINALGNPNLGAIEEFERVNTRYQFLVTERNDIDKAKREILGIISEITKEMKGIFVDRFTRIDACFKDTFTELFGGGKAALILEDENDVLNCGIEIKVQPPGKALSNISLMSGGEMAFVAIALYFAILKVRPTPFCVMDEIEAALDDANVNRYAEYMRRMADKTQFIVITHRRGTMEEADMLYGVTMQEKGVSSVLSLDIEEAVKNSSEVSK